MSKKSNIEKLFVECYQNVRVGFECCDCDKLPENIDNSADDRESIFMLETQYSIWDVDEINKLIQWLEKHKGHYVLGAIPNGEDISKLEENPFINKILKSNQDDQEQKNSNVG